ncbi:transposase [Rhodococcus sp. NPDC056960]|uniref:transposase n=1 Tax=Rhodococcus TaxID=1827 RepID=UPI00362AC696
MPSSSISPCPSCPPDAIGGHGCAVYPSSVTDAQWEILQPLPPPGNTAGRGGRPEKHCRRIVLDAILYLVRGGIAWRQLPAEFPPLGTVYAIFVRRIRGGVWQRILDTLRDRLRVRAGRDRGPTAAIVRRLSRSPTRCPDIFSAPCRTDWFVLGCRSSGGSFRGRDRTPSPRGYM